MATEEPELKTYRYKVYGNEVEGQLTAEHAERIGAKPLDDTSADEAGDAASTTQSSTGATAQRSTTTDASTKARNVAKNKAQ